MFDWLQKRRRAQILETSFPDDWETYLTANIVHFRRLNDIEKTKLRKAIQIMVAEKDWEAHGGLQMNEEIKVTIAGLASLLLLGVDDFYFENVKTVIVFPKPIRRETNSGWVIDRDTYHSGEAWQGGPVILSWQDTLKDAQTFGNGHNLVIHEFAHCLDGLDGDMAGSLQFDDRQTTLEWDRVCGEEFETLTRDVREGRETLINDYGATNKAEFFAVCSETFFEKPIQMREQHSELFDLLVKYYQVDPRKWITSQNHE